MAVPDRLPGVVRTVVLAQHHLRLVLQVLHLLRVLQAAGLCGDKGLMGWGGGMGMGSSGFWWVPHLV